MNLGICTSALFCSFSSAFVFLCVNTTAPLHHGCQHPSHHMRYNRTRNIGQPFGFFLNSLPAVKCFGMEM